MLTFLQELVNTLSPLLNAMSLAIKSVAGLLAVVACFKRRGRGRHVLRRHGRHKK